MAATTWRVLQGWSNIHYPDFFWRLVACWSCSGAFFFRASLGLALSYPQGTIATKGLKGHKGHHTDAHIHIGSLPPVSVCLSVSRRRRDSKHKDAGATHFTPPSLFAFLHDFAYLAPSSQPNPTPSQPSTQPTLLTRPIDYHRKLTTPRCTLSPSLGPIRSLDLPGIISLSPPRPLIPNSFGSAPFLIRCAALPFYSRHDHPLSLLPLIQRDNNSKPGFVCPQGKFTNWVA